MPAKEAMTVKDPKSGDPKSGVVVFQSPLPERRTPDLTNDEDSADLRDNGSLEAIALIQKKLRAQIGLVARARGANQPLPELHAALSELQQLTGSIIDDLDRVIPTLSDPQGSAAADAPHRPIYAADASVCGLSR